MSGKRAKALRKAMNVITTHEVYSLVKAEAVAEATGQAAIAARLKLGTAVALAKRKGYRIAKKNRLPVEAAGGMADAFVKRVLRTQAEKEAEERRKAATDPNAPPVHY